MPVGELGEPLSELRRVTAGQQASERLTLGGYALAWSVGFLIVFFPGGIGPREIALIAVLAPVMSSASALVVALASRVVMTIGDLFWAGIGLAVGRARGSRRPVAAPDKQPSTAQGPRP